MALLTEEKKQIIQHFRRGELDTGSSEVQIALLTYRIKKLTDHFKSNHKDHHGRRGLLNLVNRRRKLLDYLRAKQPEKYQSLLSELELRK